MGYRVWGKRALPVFKFITRAVANNKNLDPTLAVTQTRSLTWIDTHDQVSSRKHVKVSSEEKASSRKRVKVSSEKRKPPRASLSKSRPAEKKKAPIPVRSDTGHECD